LKTPPPQGNLAIGGFRKCKNCGRQFSLEPNEKGDWTRYEGVDWQVVVRENTVGRDYQGDWGYLKVGYKHMSMLNTITFPNKFRFGRKKGTLDYPI
jgi:hypothetical protein